MYPSGAFYEILHKQLENIRNTDGILFGSILLVSVGRSDSLNHNVLVHDKQIPGIVNLMKSISYLNLVVSTKYKTAHTTVNLKANKYISTENPATLALGNFGRLPLRQKRNSLAPLGIPHH